MVIRKDLAYDFIQQAKTKNYDSNPAEAEIRILDYILENRLDKSVLDDLTSNYSFMYTCLFCKDEIKPPEGVDSLATVTREHNGQNYMFTMCRECTISYFGHKDKLYGQDEEAMGRKKINRDRNNSDYGKYLPAKPMTNIGLDKELRQVEKKIRQYVETGLLEDFESYTHSGPNSHHCIFCDANLADLPVQDARKIELIVVPVGSSSSILGPVKACPSCSTYKRSALRVPNSGHFNQIKSVTCSLTGKPYPVTLEEYNSNDYAGNIILHGSTGFISQYAARDQWGKPRFEYPTCTGCQRTFVRDKLHLIAKNDTLCRECMKKMGKSNSKLPDVIPNNHNNTNLTTHVVPLDDAISCIISEVVCTRGGTSFILTFLIKAGFMEKVVSTYGTDKYNEFIDSLPISVKQNRLIEDISSYFERCPEADTCYCHATLEQAAVDAGFIYASKVHSPEYEQRVNDLVKGFKYDR